MQRDNDEIRDRRDVRDPRKNPDPISQLLMWLLPALLLGVLAYYLYQRYAMAPKEAAVVTTSEVAPVAEVTTPAAEAATTGYAKA
jgi:hypothetical protein